MLSQEKLNRINELAKKSKSTGLTMDEAKEQTKLRKEYLQAFRAQAEQTLKGVTFIDPNGNDVTPEKLKEAKRNNKLH